MAWLIDHTGIGVTDIARSVKFYDAALAPLGMTPLERVSDTGAAHQQGQNIGGVGYGATYPVYWIDIFHPGGARQHTAFRAVSREAVDEFFRAAVAAGGKSNGEPGVRAGGYPSGYYAAFVIDPDGNNIEAVYREG